MVNDWQWGVTRYLFVWTKKKIIWLCSLSTANGIEDKFNGDSISEKLSEIYMEVAGKFL